MGRASTALWLALAVITLSTHVAADGSGGFKTARATWYEDNGQGACKFGNSVGDWYGALSDQDPEFANSCGRCYEVACINMQLTDRYGTTLDRGNACIDERRTVVIKISDSCPCVHSNYASNQRWCCGDKEHLDLSPKAFAALADPKYGVIGLHYRQSSCDRLGINENGAPPASSGSPAPGGRDSSPAPSSSPTHTQYLSQPDWAAWPQDQNQQHNGRWWQGSGHMQGMGGSQVLSAMTDRMFGSTAGGAGNAGGGGGPAPSPSSPAAGSSSDNSGGRWWTNGGGGNQWQPQAGQQLGGMGLGGALRNFAQKAYGLWGR